MSKTALLSKNHSCNAGFFHQIGQISYIVFTIPSYAIYIFTVFSLILYIFYMNTGEKRRPTAFFQYVRRFVPFCNSFKVAFLNLLNDKAKQRAVSTNHQY